MTRSPRAEAAAWMGLPALPPAAVVARANRLRQRVHRGAEAGPPFVVVLERLMAIYDNVVLGVLCRNDIPEAMVRGPADAAAIAARLDAARGGPTADAPPTDAPPVDADALHRILRYASMRGLVDVDRHGRFRANRVTEALVAEAPASARPWVDFLTSASTWRTFEQADEALFGREPCRAAHGTDFFTHVNERSPADGVAFNAAMAQGSHIQALVLADAVDFSDDRRVVDVGGGTGGLARILLRHHPHLEVTVFDLPSVVAAGQARFADDPELDGSDARRCTWVGGDFFASVPQGADTYTLLSILHDWSDADAVRILTTIRTAMGSSGRCLAVDATLDERRPQDFAAATDLMMLWLTEGGRERTQGEWEDVAALAGLRIASHRALATGFSAYELVTA